MLREQLPKGALWSGCSAALSFVLYSTSPPAAETSDVDPPSAESRTGKDSVTLPEMTVTAASGSSLATDIEEALRKRLSIPAASSVQNARDYLRGAASTIEDATDFTPGLFAGQRFGNEEKLSIRGSGLSQGFAVRGILLTYDGIPLTMADGFTDEELLDPAATQYVEVYRGGSALRYGASNLGGAINFVSPTGFTAPLLGARAEFGSFDYYRGQGTRARVLGPWDYYFSGSHFSERGFRDHAARDLQRFSVNVGYRFNEGVENRTYLIAGQGDKDLPAGLTKATAEQDPTRSDDLPLFNGVSPQTFFLNQRDENYTVLLANKTALAREDQLFTASFYGRAIDLFHPLGSGPFFHQIFDIARYGYGIRLTYDNDAPLFGSRNRSSAGFDFQGYIQDQAQHDNQAGLRGPLVADSTSTAYNYSLFLEDQYYVTDLLSVVLGVHALHTTRDVEDHFGTNSLAESYTAANPRIGLIYDLDPKSNVYLTFARSYEPPTFIELQVQAVPGAFTIVDAQKASTIEMGTRGEVAGMGWDLALYYSWVDDELFPQVDSQGVGIGTTNADDTTHLGAEFGLDRIVLGPEGILPAPELAGGQIRWRLAYSFQDFTFDDDPVVGDNDIPGIPQHLLRSELLYEHPSGFYVGPNVEYAGRYPADLANTLFADSYALLGVKLGYRPKRGFGIFFEGRNLTDETYISSTNIVADARTSFNGLRVFFPGDGIALYGGIEWHF